MPIKNLPLLLHKYLHLIMTEDEEAEVHRRALKARPPQKIREIYQVMTDPAVGLVTCSSMLDFFTYRGADVSQTGIYIFFTFYSKSHLGLSFNEFEYFLTFRKYHTIMAEDEANDFDSSQHTSFHTDYKYMEDEDLILELLLREIMLFHVMHELSGALHMFDGFEHNVQAMYRLMVPILQVDLGRHHILKFMRQFTQDREIAEDVHHVLARFDVTNDMVTSYPDFKLFMERISTSGTSKVFGGSTLMKRLDADQQTLHNSKLLPSSWNGDTSRTNASQKALSRRNSTASLAANQSVCTEVSAHSQRTLSQFRSTKKLHFDSEMLTEKKCAVDISVLTLAESKDILRRYIRLVIDFHRLNSIQSLKEEICLKEVYLLLLNLKNATYDRTLNPFKFQVLFEVLDIPLTEKEVQFAFCSADKVHDGRITVDEFLNFFGGFEDHWKVRVPVNYPQSFRQLQESPIYESLRHFVEYRMKTEVELEKLRARLARKDADYTKLFLMFSEDLTGTYKPQFMQKARALGFSQEEADFFFDYLDQAPKNGHLSYGEFIRELAPSGIDLTEP